MDLGSIVGGVAHAAGGVLGGGFLGGALRMIPEVMKFFDAKDSRAHEVTMFGLQLEADKQRAQWGIDTLHAQGEAATVSGDAEAWLEAIKGQMVHSGNVLLDGLNILVRPVLTLWWCVVLPTAAMAAKLVHLHDAGVPVATALLQAWGPDELAIMFSIIAYWFADRTLRRGGGVGPAH